MMMRFQLTRGGSAFGLLVVVWLWFEEWTSRVELVLLTQESK